MTHRATTHLHLLAKARRASVIKRELQHRFAILTAVGHNLRFALAWLRFLLCFILTAIRKPLAADPKIKSASYKPPLFFAS